MNRESPGGWKPNKGGFALWIREIESGCVLSFADETLLGGKNVMIWTFANCRVLAKTSLKDYSNLVKFQASWIIFGTGSMRNRNYRIIGLCSID